MVVTACCCVGVDLLLLLVIMYVCIVCMHCFSKIMQLYFSWQSQGSLCFKYVVQFSWPIRLSIVYGWKGTDLRWWFSTHQRNSQLPQTKMYSSLRPIHGFVKFKKKCIPSVKCGRWINHPSRPTYVLYCCRLPEKEGTDHGIQKAFRKIPAALWKRVSWR